MSGAKLFTPLLLGAFELANRIVIAPMCQYSAEHGCMTDWHVIHLGHLALSGAALLTRRACCNWRSMWPSTPKNTIKEETGYE